MGLEERGRAEEEETEEEVGSIRPDEGMGSEEDVDDVLDWD